MLGNELTKADTQSQPNVQITPMGVEDGSPTYTLAMLDPDAPSKENPKFGPFRHWVVSLYTFSDPTNYIIIVSNITNPRFRDLGRLLPEKSSLQLQLKENSSQLLPTHCLPHPSMQLSHHIALLVLVQEQDYTDMVSFKAPVDPI